MTRSRCPVCEGETFEIRAKLVCRGCGMILETCCEGGPMSPGSLGSTGSSCERPSAPSAPSAPPDETRAG